MTISTSLWTTPEPGDVIHYIYLWKHEDERGLEEGKKTRPCVILSVDLEPKGLVVRAAPITTRHYSKAAIPLPPRVAAMLTLSERSVIIPTEINRFVWVGPDIVPLKRGTPFYGKVPRRLYDQLKSATLKYRATEIVRTE